MMDALREFRTLDNIYKTYLPGHDCLGGYRTSVTDPATGRGHIKRDVEHQGSLWWMEARLSIMTGDPADTSGYGEKQLVPEVLCHPLDAVQTEWITRKKGLKDVGCIYGIDLGEIERRVFEATGE